MNYPPAKKAKVDFGLDSNDPDLLKSRLKSLQLQEKELIDRSKTFCTLPKICKPQLNSPEPTFRKINQEDQEMSSEEEDSEDQLQSHNERMFFLAIQQVRIFGLT